MNNTISAYSTPAAHQDITHTIHQVPVLSSTASIDGTLVAYTVQPQVKDLHAEGQAIGYDPVQAGIPAIFGAAMAVYGAIKAIRRGAKGIKAIGTVIAIYGGYKGAKKIYDTAKKAGTLQGK